MFKPAAVVSSLVVIAVSAVNQAHAQESAPSAREFDTENSIDRSVESTRALLSSSSAVRSRSSATSGARGLLRLEPKRMLQQEISTISDTEVADLKAALAAENDKLVGFELLEDEAYLERTMKQKECLAYLRSIGIYV